MFIDVTVPTGSPHRQPPDGASFPATVPSIANSASRARAPQACCPTRGTCEGGQQRASRKACPRGAVEHLGRRSCACTPPHSALHEPREACCRTRAGTCRRRIAHSERCSRPSAAVHLATGPARRAAASSEGATRRPSRHGLPAPMSTPTAIRGAEQTRRRAAEGGCGTLPLQREGGWEVRGG